MRKIKYQPIVSNHFQDHASIYLFNVVLFFIGVIFGAIIVNSLSLIQKEDLFYYLSQFFGQVAEGKVADSKDIFMQSFFHNSKYIGLMWILGISIIGLPIILILLFLKGMVVGFTVGFLVNQMGWGGFLLSFVSILPQNFVIIPIFIFVSTLSVSISLKMIERQFMKRGGTPIFPMLGRYGLAFFGSIVLLLLAASIEAYLSPPLMKIVVNAIQ